METIYLKKIKKLSKIKIASICEKLNVNRSNLLNGRTTEENQKKVYEEIVKEYDNIIKRSQ